MIKDRNKWKTKKSKQEHLDSLIKSKKHNPTDYSSSKTYGLGQFIKHPVFGLGYIYGMIGDNKIEVFFEEFEKVLLQNWIY